MHGLYSRSENPFVDILAPMFERLDSLYWIVDCQSGPIKHDWRDATEENENAFLGLFLTRPGHQNVSSKTWRPGSFSVVKDHLCFDEWSSFLGFQSSESEAAAKAERLWKPELYSDEFWRGLKREGELYLVHMDGWWEFYPARPDVFELVSSCGSFREIWPRSSNDLDPRLIE